jgi:hypothetical protein
LRFRFVSRRRADFGDHKHTALKYGEGDLRGVV